MVSSATLVLLGVVLDRLLISLGLWALLHHWLWHIGEPIWACLGSPLLLFRASPVEWGEERALHMPWLAMVCHNCDYWACEAEHAAMGHVVGVRGSGDALRKLGTKDRCCSTSSSWAPIHSRARGGDSRYVHIVVAGSALTVRLLDQFHESWWLARGIECGFKRADLKEVEEWTRAGEVVLDRCGVNYLTATLALHEIPECCSSWHLLWLATSRLRWRWQC